jgi:prepilin-type N-terminal cleavage/methylation domain-containing protein
MQASQLNAIWGFTMMRQAGFSLLELLLVLAASSTFLFAIYQLFFHHQQQYQQQLLLQSQENSRLALHVLKNNIQTAGAAGCNSLMERSIYEIDGKIHIEKAAYLRANLAQNMTYTFDPVYITQENLFKESDSLLISDCEHAEFFTVKQIKEGIQGQILYHDGLSRAYHPNAQVMRWQVDTYYVVPNESKLALYQKTISPDTAAVELVSGLDDWVVEYAVLQNNTPTFLKAAQVNDWSKVRGVVINDFNIVLYNAKH